MNKKPIEPDEMRMPADEFDEIMRRALGVEVLQEDKEMAKPVDSKKVITKQKGKK